jgi:S1-C subfamily serine protease
MAAATFAFCSAKAALLPPTMIDGVVALGAMMNTAAPGQPAKIEWVTLGTGFFYGFKTKDDPDVTKRLYDVYLVTAGHVVAEFKDSRIAEGQQSLDLSVRINLKDPNEPSQTFKIPFNPHPPENTWFFHPNFDPKTVSAVPDYDIAVVRVNGEMIKALGASFIENDETAADVSKLKAIGASAGDGTFVLGFPMNLAGAARNYVIAREGIIARISEMLDHKSSSFLLDSFVFPGNSGSPVIIKPEIVSITGTQSNRTAYVIGIVHGYKSYLDVAVSQQTHQPRIIFEENAGLTEVIPMDRINETINSFRDAHPLSEGNQPTPSTR